MAARVSPSKGSKPDKLMRDALMLALNREARDADGAPTKKLNLIAEKLVELAVEGNIQAIKEITDRMDGKASQVLAGDPDSPLQIARIERVIVHPTSDLEWLRNAIASTEARQNSESAAPTASGNLRP